MVAILALNHSLSTNFNPNLTLFSRSPDACFDGPWSLVDHLDDLKPILVLNLFPTHFTIDDQATQISYNKTNKVATKEC